MRKKELEELEAAVAKEVMKRRGFGGYSSEAEGILFIGESTLRIISHLIETAKKDAASKKITKLKDKS